MNKNKEILELMNTDPLSEAEKITGKSYKEDKGTGFLGMALQIEKSKALKIKLEEIGDTLFSESVDSYIKKLSKFGFIVAYKEPFKNQDDIDYLKSHHIHAFLIGESLMKNSF